MRKILDVNREIAFALLLGFDLGIAFMNIPPALNTLMSLYRVSYIRISVLIGTLFWAHALMQMPAGLIADRAGLKRTLVVSLLCLTVGNFIPALFPSLGLAIAGRIIMGIGSALGFVATLKMVVLYGPKGKGGSCQAFFAGFFSFGSIVAFIVIPLLVGYGWFWIYLLPGAASLVLFVFVFRLRLEGASPVQSIPLSFRQVLGIKAGWSLGCFHALSYGSLIALSTWLPSMLSQLWNRSDATQLAWSGALVMLVSGTGRLSGGILLSRIEPLLITRSSVFILFWIFLLFSYTSSPGFVLTLAVLAAWFTSVNFGAIFHMTSRATSADSMATLIGFVNFLANLGAVLFTLLFGWIRDVSGAFGCGFAVLAFLTFTALVAVRMPGQRGTPRME